MKIKLIIALIFSTGLSACLKEGWYECDKTAPVIEVLSPADKPVLTPGSPLCIKALICDDKSLDKAWLEVNAGYRKEFPVSGRSVEINEKYIIHAEASGNLIVSLYATDESGNKGMNKIEFGVSK